MRVCSTLLAQPRLLGACTECYIMLDDLVVYLKESVVRGHLIFKCALVRYIPINPWSCVKTFSGAVKSANSYEKFY